MPTKRNSKPQLKVKKVAKKVVIRKTVVKKIVVKKTVVKKDVAKKTVLNASVVKSKNLLPIEFFNLTGKAVEEMILPKEIFGAKINDKLMAQAVRIYLANQRGGFASTKTRETVHGTTKKVWQQKGTGRARHGSRKAPIFIHGGIAHGPHPRDFSLKFSKKMKKLALFSALSSKFKNSQIKGISGFEKIEPKTKIMAGAFAKMGFDKNSNVLVVMPSENSEISNFYRASRNIEGIKLIQANVLNTYEVLNNKMILIMKKAIESLEKNFLKEENK